MKEKQTKKKFIILANLIVITLLVSSSIAIGEKITDKDARFQKEENSFVNQVVEALKEPLKEYPNISISNDGLVIDGTLYEFDEIQEPKLVERTVKSKGNDLTIIEETTGGSISLKNNDPQAQISFGIYLRSNVVMQFFDMKLQYYVRAVGFFLFFPGIQIVLDLSAIGSTNRWYKLNFDTESDISIAGGYVRAEALLMDTFSGLLYRAWSKVICYSDGTWSGDGETYLIG